MSDKRLNSDTMPCPLKLRVYADTKQGGRNYMEDFVRIKIADVSSPGGDVAYLGVFDGHGGPEAARLAQATLGVEIARLMGSWADDSDATVIKAIKQAFVNTHRLMNKFVGMWPKTISGLPSTAGTTASVVMIRGDKLYVAHVGDSAVVLGKINTQTGADESKAMMDPSIDSATWVAECVTTDHKPECPIERRRIEESGGEVIAKAGVHRVVWYRPRPPRASNRLSSGSISGAGGESCLVDTVPFLAVARALGDLWSYNRARDVYVVSPEPDVSVHHLDRSLHRCVILASDGVWNMVGALEAVKVVQYCVRQYERLALSRTLSSLDHSDASARIDRVNNPAARLVNLALDRWSSKRLRADNTSAIVVLFQADDNTQFHPDALTEYCSDPCKTPDAINEMSFALPPQSLPSSSVPFCQQLAKLNVQGNRGSTRESNGGEVEMNLVLPGNLVLEGEPVRAGEGETRPDISCVPPPQVSNVQVNSLVPFQQDSSTRSSHVQQLAVRLDIEQLRSTDTDSLPVGSGMSSDIVCSNKMNHVTPEATVELLRADVPFGVVCETITSDSTVGDVRDITGCTSGKFPLIDIEEIPLLDNRVMINGVTNIAELSKCVTGEQTDTSSPPPLLSQEIFVSLNERKLNQSVDERDKNESSHSIIQLSECRRSPHEHHGVNTRVDIDEVPESDDLYAKSLTAHTVVATTCRLSKSKKRKAGKQIMNMEKRMMHTVCSSSIHVKRHLTRYHIEQIHVEQS